LPRAAAKHLLAASVAKDAVSMGFDYPEKTHGRRYAAEVHRWICQRPEARANIDSPVNF